MTDVDWTLSDSDEHMVNMCVLDIRSCVEEGNQKGAEQLLGIQREMLRLAEVRLRRLDQEYQAVVRGPGAVPDRDWTWPTVEASERVGAYVRSAAAHPGVR